MATERKKQQDRDRMQRHREIQESKIACIDLAIDECRSIISAPWGDLWSHGTLPTAYESAIWKGRREAAQEILDMLTSFNIGKIHVEGEVRSLPDPLSISIEENASIVGRMSKILNNIKDTSYWAAGSSGEVRNLNALWAISRDANEALNLCSQMSELENAKSNRAGDGK